MALVLSPNSGEDVELYIYDLTRRVEEEGTSRMALSSIQSFASAKEIPHLSIVVFGKEYTFTQDAGIVSTFANSNHRGRGFKESCLLGKTRKTRNELENFLHSLSVGDYEVSTYSVLRNNCITFSNEVSEFLLGKSIPD
jgi:desumoylating isopeptidase 1